MVGFAPALDAFPSVGFAKPKSRSFTMPSDVTLMFAGFRSRWYGSGEVHAFHQFHHDGACFDSVDGGNVRMVQRCQHLGFAVGS